MKYFPNWFKYNAADYFSYKNFFYFDRITTIKYRADKLFGSQARLVIHQSRVEMAQELVIEGSEKIIIGPNGRISFSTNEDIVPIDEEGNDLNER